MECDAFLGDFFCKWCHENERIASHISISMDRRDGSESPSQFAARRAATHNSVCDELAKFREKVAGVLVKTERQLKQLSLRPIPTVPRLLFDQQSQNMSVRKVVVVDSELLRLRNSAANKRLVFLQDVVRCMSNAIALFGDARVIPGDLCLKVEPSFYVIDLDEIARDEREKIEGLSRYRACLVEEIRGFPTPVWVRDYPKFLNDLIDELLPRVDSLCLYVAPHEKEVSLSRCFFNARSEYARRIDNVICKNLGKEEFVAELINLCYDLMPGREAMPADRQSVALLVLFRAVFDRVYETLPSVFWRVPDADLVKVRKMAGMPLNAFSVPLRMLSKKWDGDTLIETVFRSEPLLQPASEFLFSAIFDCNPIDALYAVHKCLLCIKKAAWINSKSNSGQPIIFDEVNAFLCFDDFFSLLIGVMIASDVPDIFYLAWFVSTYIPKDKVSASFTFALANLEGLAGHFRTL